MIKTGGRSCRMAESRVKCPFFDFEAYLREMKTEVRKDDLNNEEEQDESATDATASENEAVIERRLSQEELQELETQAAKATEYWEQLLRTAADLENYKKRAAREKQDA